MAVNVKKLPQANSYEELIARFQWDIPERYNIGVDICDKWAAQEPERLALLHKAQDGSVQSFTFANMQYLSNQTANLLRTHGVEVGDRVAVMLPQAPETGYAHIAAYKMGAIAMPLFALFGPEALAYRLQNSGTKAIITNASGAARVMQIREELPDLEMIFSIDGAATGVLDFHAERERQSGDFTPVDTSAEDPALLIYTSGTTGPPKGALHVHRTLLGHLPGMAMSLSLFPQPGDRIWTPADWAWIGALYDVVIPAWHYGVTVVSHRFDKFDPEAAFQLIEDFEVRTAFLPPTALKMMRGVKEPEKRWRLDLRSISSGGEALGAELLEWGRRTFGLTINEMYGQTECNLIVMTCSTIMAAKPGSIGRPAPGHEVAIIDETGQVLPPGQPGQIACKRPDPVMMVQYWHNPEATSAKFKGDWLLTGDMGVMDDEGYIRFIGRNDDVINSAGYRIGPGEVEDCLMGHPAVKMTAVIGVPDELRNEVVKAYIVLDDGVTPTEALRQEIQNHVKMRLAAHEYPRHIAFVAEFPMTTTGKIMRRTLRQWHEAGI